MTFSQIVERIFLIIPSTQTVVCFWRLFCNTRLDIFSFCKFGLGHEEAMHLVAFSLFDFSLPDTASHCTDFIPRHCHAFDVPAVCDVQASGVG